MTTLDVCPNQNRQSRFPQDLSSYHTKVETESGSNVKSAF